ncbi:DUF1569 domain-containing protein [Mucilaginibacter flavus]|uniref:DUF1569 domain-containing protein n=1 Tax=Mucilaginibacter flavus TaxID=931504 RepID=UPI0025B58725|nr:DUF1569 domain-containing protein [Mucilaginibacter flavus]MDN3579580.1 DUF1569 domain-containing protein [Mucilaginibacter flavus]
MQYLIEKSNRHNLFKLLKKLEPTTLPLWGKMNAQQMVEHLITNVKYTNGTFTFTCKRSPEEANRSKQVMIYTDTPMPMNIVLGDLPSNYAYPNLSAAIEQLMKELATFDQHFKTPGITEDHLSFGSMNHQEWIIWHSKHFTHHFKQFGLLSA